MIGLPYWAWDDVTVTVNHADGTTHDEVFPKILRDRLNEFPEDFFPPEAEESMEPAWKATQRSLDVAEDDQLRGRFDPALGEQARRTLRSKRHSQHACTYRDASELHPSIETPHNHVHTNLPTPAGGGGVMASYQSAFHPVFWLHHNNIDRFYEKYLFRGIDTSKCLLKLPCFGPN
jgi:hypothetical protein